MVSVKIWIQLQIQMWHNFSLAPKLVSWSLFGNSYIQSELCATKKLGYKFCGAVYDSHEQDM